jgi:hypothetical protein
MSDADFIWEPLSLDETASLFANWSRPWWIAGGWAVELFIGRPLRDHGDVDVAILRGDLPAIADLLPDWDIRIADSGTLTPWDRRAVKPPLHGLWARRRGSNAWNLELLLQDHARDDWLFRKDHRITCPLAQITRVTPAGTPYLAPEICLLYKSGSPNLDRNAADFTATAPLLDRDARAWLLDAIATLQPRHPWIDELSP